MLVLREIVGALIQCPGPTCLVKVKSHMGIPLNAAADAQADIEAAGYPEMALAPEAALMPLQFRACIIQPPPPVSLFTQARKNQDKQQHNMTPLLPSPWTGMWNEMK